MRCDIMRVDRLRMGTDGKGVSTLVTFFNCPLHCKYCINDHYHYSEDIDFDDEIRRACFTPKELIEVLKKDSIYYRMSGGGIVFGGGEPLLQSSFINRVCALADPDWQIRVETSLNVPWHMVKPLLDDVDEWIIDIKDMNKEIYRQYTGVENRYVTRNLRKLYDSVGASKMHIRIPRIKHFNTEQDVEKSRNWIESRFQIKPEVFDYIIPQ